jgi:hypothetical protein
MSEKGNRIVYIVQRLDWVYQDFLYNIEEEYPVKAFTRRSEAEGYRQTLEHDESKKWQPEYNERRRGDTLQFFEVIPVELEAE